MEWHSVADGLPTEKGYYWVCQASYGSKFWYFVFWDGSGWYQDNWGYTEDVTHYMRAEIPAPPGGGEWG